MSDLLLRLVELAYDCALGAKGWEVLLVQIAAALHATQPALFTHDPQRAGGAPLVAPQLDDGYRRAYRDHFSRRNVLLERYRERLVPGSLRTSAAMVPRGDFLRSEYYNDFCKPLDMDHSLAATLEARGHCTANVCFWRSSTSPAFQPEDFALLQALLPHLRRVLTFGELMAQERQQAALATLLGRRLTQALIGFDADGRVCWTNGEAEEVFRARDGLVAERGELRASTPARTAALRGAVHAATRAALELSWREISISLPRPSGRRNYTAVVVPVRLAEEPLLGEGVLRALALVADPERAPRVPQSVLASAFGLTTAESRVAALLARGRGVDDICECLDVSANTVRTHLKRIYQKTATTRQADLVALLVGSLGSLMAAPSAEDDLETSPLGGCATASPPIARPGGSADHRPTGALPGACTETRPVRR